MQDLGQGPGAGRHHIGNRLDEIGVRPKIIPSQTVVPLACGGIVPDQGRDRPALKQEKLSSSNCPLDILRAAEVFFEP